MELSEKGIRALPVPASGQRITYFADASRAGKCPVGFAVRVTASGGRAFLLCYRDAAGEHRATIGKSPAMSLVLAIRRAAELRLRVDGGDTIAVKRGAAKAAALSAKAAIAPTTVNDVFAEWLLRKGQHLRSVVQYERGWRNHISPAIGSTPIMELRKRPIVEMLDRVSDAAGPGAQQQVIVQLSSVLNWYAARDDDFRPPVLRGLKAKMTSRARVLTHDEIRVLWPAFDGAGVFGTFAKLLLLTGARRNEWADAKWSEIDSAAATLTIPSSRYKTARDHVIPLTATVRDLLSTLPRRAGSDRIFAVEVGGFTLGKRRVDALAPTIASWRLHDLRRTSVNLMVEAGVSSEVADRVIGHVQGGVAATYNRHHFLPEKVEALEKLAAMVARILDPAPAAKETPNNVSVGDDLAVEA